MNNIAYIDGQNLFMGTTNSKDPWEVKLEKFRIYLKQKYNVNKAYYYLGFVQEKYQDLYEEIQSAGFILVFRQHNPAMLGTKKGNVDSDIILNAMVRLYKKESFEKIILVSGDGDYKGLVDFLIKEDKFGKILFPDQKKASSLYKSIDSKYTASISDTDVRRKIS